jgi:hypothetical protein
MKNVVLDGARLSASVGAGFVTRRMLREIRIAYDASPRGTRYPGGAKAAACISVDFDVTESRQIRTQSVPEQRSSSSSREKLRESR